MLKEKSFYCNPFTYVVDTSSYERLNKYKYPNSLGGF